MRRPSPIRKLALVLVLAGVSIGLLGCPIAAVLSVAGQALTGMSSVMQNQRLAEMSRQAGTAMGGSQTDRNASAAGALGDKIRKGGSGSSGGAGLPPGLGAAVQKQTKGSVLVAGTKSRVDKKRPGKGATVLAAIESAVKSVGKGSGKPIFEDLKTIRTTPATRPSAAPSGSLENKADALVMGRTAGNYALLTYPRSDGQILAAMPGLVKEYETKSGLRIGDDGSKAAAEYVDAFKERFEQSYKDTLVAMFRQVVIETACRLSLSKNVHLDQALLDDVGKKLFPGSRDIVKADDPDLRARADQLGIAWVRNPLIDAAGRIARDIVEELNRIERIGNAKGTLTQALDMVTDSRLDREFERIKDRSLDRGQARELLRNATVQALTDLMDKGELIADGQATVTETRPTVAPSPAAPGREGTGSTGGGAGGGAGSGGTASGGTAGGGTPPGPGASPSASPGSQPSGAQVDLTEEESALILARVLERVQNKGATLSFELVQQMCRELRRGKDTPTPQILAIKNQAEHLVKNPDLYLPGSSYTRKQADAIAREIAERSLDMRAMPDDLVIRVCREQVPGVTPTPQAIQTLKANAEALLAKGRD